MTLKKLLQLHLLTLLAITLCAAGLLGLNMLYSPGYPYIADYTTTQEGLYPIIKRYPSIGWPRAFVYHNPQITFVTIEQNNVNGPAPSLPIFHPGTLNDGPKINRKNLAIDIATALGLMLAVGAACEWTLRHRRSAPFVIRHS